MNNTQVIEAALIAVKEAHEEYTPLNEEYRTAMSNAGEYEVVPGLDDSMHTRACVTLDMLMSGELTTKGRERAVEAGLIRKIKAAKPAELVAAEELLQNVTSEYLRVTSEAILPYQFVKSRGTRTHSDASPGEVGAGKKADVTASIKRIDPEAVVNFAGRRVFGTIGKGITFDYDVYGQSYLHSLQEKVNQ